MIVDDNEDFIQRMTGMLDEMDTVDQIQFARNYDEACELMSTDSPDLILLDIALPGKNGISLLKKIRQSTWKGDVIMLSNHSGDFYRERCKRLGALYFLDKTAEFDMVPKIIHRLHAN